MYVCMYARTQTSNISHKMMIGEGKNCFPAGSSAVGAQMLCDTNRSPMVYESQGERRVPHTSHWTHNREAHIDIMVSAVTLS